MDNENILWRPIGTSYTKIWDSKDGMTTLIYCCSLFAESFQSGYLVWFYELFFNQGYLLWTSNNVYRTRAKNTAKRKMQIEVKFTFIVVSSTFFGGEIEKGL